MFSILITVLSLHVCVFVFMICKNALAQDKFSQFDFGRHIQWDSLWAQLRPRQEDDDEGRIVLEGDIYLFKKASLKCSSSMIMMS